MLSEDAQDRDAPRSDEAVALRANGDAPRRNARPAPKRSGAVGLILLLLAVAG